MKPIQTEYSVQSLIDDPADKLEMTKITFHKQKRLSCVSAGVMLQGQTQITLSCIQLHKKAERIAAVLSEKAKLNSGQHVALLFPPGLDLIAAFYGCLYAGK